MRVDFRRLRTWPPTAGVHRGWRRRLPSRARPESCSRSGSADEAARRPSAPRGDRNKTVSATATAQLAQGHAQNVDQFCSFPLSDEASYSTTTCFQILPSIQFRTPTIDCLLAQGVLILTPGPTVRRFAGSDAAAGVDLILQQFADQWSMRGVRRGTRLAGDRKNDVDLLALVLGVSRGTIHVRECYCRPGVIGTCDWFDGARN